MPTNLTPAPPGAADDALRWRTLAVTGGLLGVEACLVWTGFGPWLLALQGKRPVVLAAAGMLGGLWAHIEAHRREYAAVRLSWPLLAVQVAAFGAACAVLGQIAAEVAPPGPEWLLPLVVGIAAVPVLATLVVIAPNAALARQLLGGVGLCVAGAGLAWTVGNLTTRFWRATSGATISLVELLLTPFAGGPVVRPEPLVIGTEAFQVEISPACSGFHGIGLITVLLVGWLWWFRRSHRFPQALLLLPLGVALMWVVNALRIAALILVGIFVSPAIAVDGFHSAAGWIGFLAVGLGIIWAASRSSFFTLLPERNPADVAGSAAQTTAAAAGGANGPIPTTACILPFLALTAVTLLTRAFTSR